MKKMTVHILCSTGITLIILALAGKISGAEFLCINSVFESFAANIVVYVGLLFTRKIECNYAIIEFMIDLGYTILVLIIFGTIFDWYQSTPIWMLAMIAFVVYAAGIFLSIIRIQKDIDEINVLLNKRNNKAALKGEKRDTNKT